jgi:hypothetical protein
MKLTDQSLLAQLLGTIKVLLPLEQSQSLVDQGKNIHAGNTLLLLHLDSSLELLNSFRVLLLVKQQLTIVVVDVRNLLKVLDTAAESGHR